MIDHHALYIKLKRKMIKSDIKKGDIYYASLNPAIGSEQKGERPVVVLQNDCGNKYSPTVIVAPLTKIIKKEKLPTHILIHSNAESLSGAVPALPLSFSVLFSF